MLVALRRWGGPLALLGLWSCGVVLDLDKYDLPAASATVGAGGSGAAGGGGAGGGDMRCGGLGALADDFADGELTVGWRESSNGGTFTEIDGRAALSVPASGGLVERTTVHHHDMRDDYIMVEVTEVPTSGTLWLQVLDGDAAENYLTITANSSELVVSQNGQNQGAIDYDPVAHRFWRIGHANGKIYAETVRSLGDAWEHRYSIDSGALFDPQYTIASVGINSSGSVGGVDGKFASINGGTPRQSYCKAETFTHDFADMPGLAWQRSTTIGNCGIAATGDGVTLSVVSNVGGGCAYVSATAFDLVNSSFTMRVEPDMVPPTQYFMSVMQDDENHIDVQTDNGQLDFNEAVNDDDKTITTQAIPTDPYWRLRGVDGDLVMESSFDGLLWKKVDQIDANNNLDAVRLAFGVWDPGPGGAVTFSDLNGPPP
jgi:hypothetical protein